jgi:choline dehydrogenase-like flavoprotein
MLTAKEKNLRIYLKFLTGIYFLLFIVCILRLFEKTGTSHINFPFLISISALSLTKFLLCWFSVSDLRRFILLVKLILFGSIISLVASILILLQFEINGFISLLNMSILLKNITYIAAGLNLLNVILISLLLHSAEKERFGLKYFSPNQFKTIKALADVVIYGEQKIISGEDVARNVDKYFKSFEAKSKWTMGLVVTALYYYPILSLKPPLPYISPYDRHEFLKKRFYRDVEARLIPEFWRIVAQGLIRIAKQMCYIGYYNDKRTFDSVGYIPFSERKDRAERMQKNPANQLSPPLEVKTEKDINEESIEGDVVIIGSGAAASILAKGLVENGRKVLMIERGNYERPETFNENEMEMVSRLFQDGAIQAARDFRFTVFQGSCVGGSTVVNNAVCFKMPETVLDRWNDTKGLNAGLNKAQVMASMDRVWEMIGTNHMDEDKVNLNPGGYLFREGCRKLGYDIAPSEADSVNANISSCLGCGYCNIGCKYDRKLSMLVTILPGIQKNFSKESLRILAGCEVTKLHKSGGKISYLEGVFNNGRKLKVYGKTFVVSAGAISSSILLLKSNLGIKNAGMNLSFNVGTQITAAFPNKINSYDGLQISHYLRLSPDRGFVMESWFNPPMFQSTAMPGWFEDHYRNMRRYDRLACVGILVGSESNAQARVAGLTHREIKYTPTNKDFQTLLTGLELSGEIMLASGAESVMPNTFKYYEFKNTDELKKIHKLIKDPSEITLGTGHPQGGNIISSSPETGVINPEFKVFGYENLFVCDASVFPTSLGVNPQLTVMGLADYAVQFIKDN